MTTFNPDRCRELIGERKVSSAATISMAWEMEIADQLEAALAEIERLKLHDRCIVEGCDRVLHSMAEGRRGTCSSCWVKGMKPETKSALNRLIRSAFNGADDTEKGAAVDAAFKALEEEEQK